MKFSLAAINAMSAQQFSIAFGRVFEHSPWIAERSFASKPFANLEALHAAMVNVVRSASEADQLALLRAHPELAGREAQTNSLTPESTTEQRKAGLTALNSDEMARIVALNAAHADRFGFPFIIAARLHDKAQIFAEFERRMTLARDAEIAACLEQVYRITRLRLDDLIEV